MTYRYGPFLCLVLAGALAIASADTSINLVWNTNPDCLGPSSGSAQWNNLDDGSCASYNSSYNGILYSHITSVDNGTCNNNGETTYTLFADDECNSTTGLPTIFNTACSPWAGTGEAPLGTQPLPDLPPVAGVPITQSPDLAPVSIPVEPTTQQPIGSGSTGSQQFSCNGTFEMKPYVQLIGPGCSDNDQPQLNQWTVTWSNAPGCVPVYNTSSISIGFGNMEITYAQVDGVCQSGATNYTVNFFSDSACANALGSLTFDDGCSEQFNATCHTTGPIAPSGDPIPIEPITVTPSTTGPDIPPVLINEPTFTPFFPPSDVAPPTDIPTVPIDVPSAASTMTASAFLLVAVAVLAYLL